MGNNDQPQGLLLDAMGTLIGLRASVGTTYAAFAADHGITVEAEAIDAVFPDLFHAAPPMAFPGLSGSALLEAEQNWWSTLIASCLENCGHQQPMPQRWEKRCFSTTPPLRRGRCTAMWPNTCRAGTLVASSWLW